ncbi:MAG: D-tyrosyl-tRNA(Tyr) deacylase [candidate division WOR-3 bacterium]|nr:MAG: D-tyrosyl-tRNA(Tyr) deacylase [candidate division WOR-3 bacterium]
MIAVIQRVREAEVCVGEKMQSNIGRGILVLLGVKRGDDEATARRLAERCMNLRIFEDEQGKFNHSLKDIGGEALIVSQFTLLADTSRGRRPSFSNAEEPKLAEVLYGSFIDAFTYSGITARSGSFGDRMSVALVNEGPVTIILEE